MQGVILDERDVDRTPVVQGVIPCRCGRRMRVVRERRMPERRTRPCSRPLRARDRWLFDRCCGALAAADGQPVGRFIINAVPFVALV